MSEEKIKKKSKLSVFFLVGPDPSISEDSSTIEYSASALRLKKKHCEIVIAPIN